MKNESTLRRKFHPVSRLLCIAAAAWLYTASVSATGLRAQILGRWNNVPIGETINFYKDGTFVQTYTPPGATPAVTNSVVVRGEFSMWPGGKMRMRVNGDFFPRGAVLTTVAMADVNTLTITDRDGQPKTYQRVPALP